MSVHGFSERHPIPQKPYSVSIEKMTFKPCIYLDVNLLYSVEKKKCVCMHMRTCIQVHLTGAGTAYAHLWAGRPEKSIRCLFCGSPLYSLDTKSLTDPGGRLSSGQSAVSCSCPSQHCSYRSVLDHNHCVFHECLGFELRSSWLCSKHFYPLSHPTLFSENLIDLCPERNLRTT